MLIHTQYLRNVSILFLIFNNSMVYYLRTFDRFQLLKKKLKTSKNL